MSSLSTLGLRPVGSQGRTSPPRGAVRPVPAGTKVPSGLFGKLGMEHRMRAAAYAVRGFNTPGTGAVTTEGPPFRDFVPSA
jgi:hypothetical protein